MNKLDEPFYFFIMYYLFFGVGNVCLLNTYLCIWKYMCCGPRFDVLRPSPWFRDAASCIVMALQMLVRCIDTHR